MSNFPSMTAAHESVTGGFLNTAARIIKRRWYAYVAWRIEEATIAFLKSMSDRELKDIGLSRSQIYFAVRGAHHDHRFSRVY
jgi:uncharacterized protein YjiS (DUF1127 family)